MSVTLTEKLDVALQTVREQSYELEQRARRIEQLADQVVRLEQSLSFSENARARLASRVKELEEALARWSKN